MSIIFISLVGATLDMIVNWVERIIEWKYKRTHYKRKLNWK